MIEDTLVVNLADLPMSLNEWVSLHWKDKADLKETWAWALREKLGRRPHVPYPHLVITARLYFGIHRRRDAENYGAVLWKVTLDGLQAIGWLADDTPEYVTTSNPELLVDKDLAPLTELTIKRRR